jgi:uncharacterized sulfatase
MKRRSLLATPLACLAQTPAVTRPNVVVVMMDDFGIGHFAPTAASMRAADLNRQYAAWLKTKGVKYTAEQALDCSRRAMPNVSALAKTGVLFTNNHATSNLCAPSRAGLLTGRMQNQFGHYQNSDTEASGVPAGMILAQYFQGAGYATGFIGKWHVGTRDEALRLEVLKRANGGEKFDVEAAVRATGHLGAVVRQHHPLEHGFDYYYGYNRWECPFYNSEHIWENYTYTGKQPRYNTELFAEKAVAFLGKSLREKKPFYLHIAPHAVHGPLEPKAPERHFSKFPSPEYKLTNFYAHVHAVDEMVGQIRGAMTQEEWDNTLFAFCADNGAPVALDTVLPGNGAYRGHKGSVYMGGLRTPLLMHWPKGLGSRGRSVNAMTSNMDVLPTALNAAGIGLPVGVEGVSLLPLARGEAKSAHEHLMWAGIHARAWGFTRETTIGQFNQRREESPGAWAVTDGTYMLRYVTATPAGLFSDVPEGEAGHFELHDLREDVQEERNLAPQLPQVVERLKSVYKARARSLPPPSKWRRDRWEEMNKALAN